MTQINACIAYISSRNKCISHSLKSMWDNYNFKHNYPVYVFYFDDIYDDKNLREHIKGNTDQIIYFQSVPYALPDIPEEEIYYSRNELWYVRTSFPKSRAGYLHMCNFNSNLFGYPDTNLEKYDYIMTHDDESGYEKEMDFDPFEMLDSSGYMLGAYSVGQRLKNGYPHQGHLDCRIGLWEFTKNSILDNNITPKSEQLKKLLFDSDANNNFHFIDWCDTYVINTDVFKTDLWKRWISSVNDNGGIYKYRWGDNEIESLFAHMYQDKIFKIPAVDNGFHNQGKFRYIQDYAPGVKN